MSDDIQVFRRATSQTEKPNLKPAFVWNDETLINDRLHEALYHRDEITRDEIDQLLESIMDELKSDSHHQIVAIGEKLAQSFGYPSWARMNSFNYHNKHQFKEPEKILDAYPVKNLASYKLLTAGKKRVGHGFDKEPYTFLRGVHGSSKKIQRLLSKDVSPELQTRIDKQLEIFDGRDSIGQAVFARIVEAIDAALPELSSQEVLDRCAANFGYIGWNNMKKKSMPAVAATEALRNRKAILQSQERQVAYKSRLLKVPKAMPQLVHLLFYAKPVYLEAIERLLVTYHDEYLDTARDKYGLRFTKYAEWRCTLEDTFESFGQFLREVRKLDEVFQNPIEPDGLKTFARMLYCWHYRRFIPVDFMVRHCKHLPRKYRQSAFKNHYENCLGSDWTDGPDYSDVEIAPDDDPRYQGEEEGDNIGNR